MRVVHRTNKCFKFCSYVFVALLLSPVLCVPLAFSAPNQAAQYQRTLTRESYAVWG